MKDLRRVVWSEVRKLRAEENGDLGILSATIGNIAQRLHGIGFFETAPPADPGADRDLCDKVSADAMEGSLGSFRGSALSNSAALVEVDARMEPIAPQGIDLPNGFDWVKDKDRSNVLGVYMAAFDGSKSVRRYALFVPKTPDVQNNAAFYSSLTQTGQRKLIAPNRSMRSILAGALGVLSVFLFCWGAGSAHWTGHLISRTNSLLEEREPGYRVALQEEFANRLKRLPSATPALVFPKDPPQCLKWLAAKDKADADKQLTEPQLRNACMLLWSSAMSVANSNLEPALDKSPDQAGTINNPSAGKSPEVKHWDVRAVWAAAMGSFSQPSKNGIGLASLGPSILTPTLLMMASVVPLGIAAGLGVLGVGKGILVNEQNRVSLARLQVCLWSVVVLPLLIAYACFNSGLTGPFTTFKGTLNLFPSVPTDILAALGIAFGSPMLSALILKGKGSSLGLLGAIKSAVGAAPTQAAIANSGSPDVLSRNSARVEASFSDVVLGEERANDSNVDLSRVQMLVVTMGLVFTYFVSGLSNMSSLSVAGALTYLAGLGPSAVNANPELGGFFASLPQMGSYFSGFLLASHSAYLVTKASDKETPQKSLA